MPSTRWDRARLTADAVNRTVRTFIQAILAEAVIVVVPEVQRLLSDEATVWDINAARSLARIALLAALAFVMRRYADLSPIPTPLPPSDPGVPADPPAGT